MCPVCDHVHSRSCDWCPECGAYLGLLKRQPLRVAACVLTTILVGAGLFGLLAWQVFGPVLRGWPPGGGGPWFWWGFTLASFLLALGLTAGRHLSDALRRMIGSR